MTKEEKFYIALRDVFVGARVEGESGHINLMRIKARYYEKGVFPRLKQDVDEALKPFPGFRNELFEKLYDFFHRYFSESGSIYFRYTPLHQNVYDKVYTNDKDVMLFWKTRMLYYVKTDRLFTSMDVVVDGHEFHFDVSMLEHKRANEKRDIVYSFREKRMNALVFTVTYSKRGSKTKFDEILRSLHRSGAKANQDTLKRAFRIFEKQSEVDFFINKDARAFLEEQFNLWFYQYVFSGVSAWTELRVKQLQTLKDIAFKIIAFISQFENELVKIWNKPKFVLNSNYVIDLGRIAKKDIALVGSLIAHRSFDTQIGEWQQLGIVDESFRKTALLQQVGRGKRLAEQYQYLPIDTKHFKDMELDIVGLFDDLDVALDGWLIKSENYQALNTILPKFAEKVQTIYIDPPFNTGDDFLYVDRFQDSTWLSLFSDRIRVGRDLLSNSGSFYLHMDKNANHYSKILLNDIFKADNYKAEITWDTCGITGFKSSPDNWIRNADYLIYYAKDLHTNAHIKTYSLLDKAEKRRLNLGWLDVLGTEDTPYIERWHKGVLASNPINTACKLHPVGMLWTDVYSFLFTQVGNNESFFFTTQKPEHLLRRIIQSSTHQRNIVLDFFLGIGTTVAVAHKLNRKWIGIEMADHFDTFYVSNGESKIGTLGRMKIVVSGDQKFHVFGRPRHPQLSRNMNWQGGGFFKYYEMEQYEDSLRSAKYGEADLFNDPNKDVYHQYVFLRDLKMLDSLEVNTEANEVKVDLSKLYEGIDVAETISNLTGKWIKRISRHSVEFDDGEVVDVNNLEWRLVKPLIWW